MEDLSEEAIRKNCPHCDPNSQAFIDLIEETPHFRVVCDHHPLTEGHMLIIPKQHLACIGEYPRDVFAEFEMLFKKTYTFIHKHYGQTSTFEHGKIGQTVFHSHVHLLPFSGTAAEIIPEGPSKLKPLNNLADLKDIFSIEGQYLYFSIANSLWTVDTSLGAPRFFRDRFAHALKRPERGNWKTMHMNKVLMAETSKENTHCIALWHEKYK